MKIKICYLRLYFQIGILNKNNFGNVIVITQL